MAKWIDGDAFIEERDRARDTRRMVNSRSHRWSLGADTAVVSPLPETTGQSGPATMPLPEDDGVAA